ncbi:MAG: TRAP transporter small permease [Spirochaetae bacterium HGW-Spirochaetae-1]|jgi:TRAP-type C4-dicarboxylate transport system permease small subunit|nr:MAG: TRAP transporter small permease [Spirochaetae bacterium HGW-Spirochaetae-1]
MIRLTKIIFFVADRANWISALSIALMMVITVIDVILRLFRCPIPGTYDVVGLLGALTISFSLGYTSIEKGHISVDFIMQKFPEKIKMTVNTVNNLIATVFFAVAAWQSMLYAMNLRDTGEVSLTLQIPTYPFVMGVSAGCLLLCLVLIAESMQSMRGVDIE